MTEDSMTHLHVHSMGSLLDGLPTPEEIIDRTVELGQKAVALTDHGSLAASLRFYQAAEKAGVKPLIGMEGYLANDMEHKEKSDPTYHIGLIAKNNTGLKNLYAISDIAWNQGFYRKPRIDLSVLDSHREGIIVLTGCMDGCISKHIRNDDMKSAKIWKENLASACDDLYFEIQPWNTPELNQAIIDFAGDDYPVVPTADTHFNKQEDKFAVEVALLIQLSKDSNVKNKLRMESLFSESRKITNEMDRLDFLHPNRMISFKDIDNYLMSRRNLEAKFGDHRDRFARPEYFANTMGLADSCNVTITTDGDYFPIFSRHNNSDDLLKEVAYEGMERLGFQNEEEYVERLEEELAVIKRLNFSNYMLLVWDVVHYAKSSDIMVGPGRGSVGGSLLAYVLGITEVDPIVENLLFWRFLNVAVKYEPRFEAIIS